MVYSHEYFDSWARENAVRFAGRLSDPLIRVQQLAKVVFINPFIYEEVHHEKKFWARIVNYHHQHSFECLRLLSAENERRDSTSRTGSTGSASSSPTTGMPCMSDLSRSDSLST